MGHPVDVIIGCTASRMLLPAAWLAAQDLGLPFVAYLFDDPVYQWPDSSQRQIARQWERRWSMTAAAIISTNEVLAADVSARCGVSCEVLRNCIVPAAFAGPASAWPTKSGELSIVYTGAVYHAHYDAFVNLVRALPHLSVPATLHIYTEQDEVELRRLGIDGPVVYHEHLPSKDIHTVQQKADILFLPMAFNSSIPEVIRSSAPGKMGEYLASCRPVLAHAPADSFVSIFCKERGCGFVADALSPQATAKVIEEIISNAELREDTVKRARFTAREFSPDSVRHRFNRIMVDVTVGSSIN
jgi:glycosyltransferase involved in cell wall biosynthesis